MNTRKNFTGPCPTDEEDRLYAVHPGAGRHLIEAKEGVGVVGGDYQRRAVCRIGSEHQGAKALNAPTPTPVGPLPLRDPNLAPGGEEAMARRESSPGRHLAGGASPGKLYRGLMTKLAIAIIIVCQALSGDPSWAAGWNTPGKEIQQCMLVIPETYRTLGLYERVREGDLYSDFYSGHWMPVGHFHGTVREFVRLINEPGVTVIRRTKYYGARLG
jgi:hypothetical protein